MMACPGPDRFYVVFVLTNGYQILRQKQQFIRESRQGRPTFHSSKGGSSIFHHSIRLNKKMAVKNTVIPINCRNSDTFNYRKPGMPFVTVPGLTGKVFVPESQTTRPKKHPCKDCYSCQMCADDRCSVCRRQQESGGRNLSTNESS